MVCWCLLLREAIYYMDLTIDTDIHFCGYRWLLMWEATSEVYYCLLIDVDVWFLEKSRLKLDEQLNIIIF